MLFKVLITYLKYTLNVLNFYKGKLQKWFVSEHVNGGFVFNIFLSTISRRGKKDFKLITSRSKERFNVAELKHFLNPFHPAGYIIQYSYFPYCSPCISF